MSSREKDSAGEPTAAAAGIIPAVVVEFIVEKIGYQADFYLNGKLLKIECRDFGGAPTQEQAIKKLFVQLDRAVERWRKSL